MNRNYELDLEALNELAASLLEKCSVCNSWVDSDFGESCCDASNVKNEVKSLSDSDTEE